MHAEPVNIDPPTEKSQSDHRTVLWRASVSVDDSRSQSNSSVMDHGYDGVELVLLDESLHDVSTLHDRGPDRTKIGAVAARMNTTELKEAVAATISLIEWSAHVSAACLNLSIPPLGDGRDSTSFARYQDALNFCYQLCRGVRFEAESRGVNLALEANQGDTLSSPVEARELVDSAHSGAIGLCVDLSRLSHERTARDWLWTLGHRVKAVRLYMGAQSSVDPLSAHWIVPLESLCDACSEIRLEGPLIVSSALPGDISTTQMEQLRGLA